MRVNIPVIALAVILILTATTPCLASETSDFELILTTAKLGHPLGQNNYLKKTKAIGDDLLYEGELHGISILVWVESGIVDSVFLTVRGKQYHSWSQVIGNYLAQPSIDQANSNGRILRYYDDNYEYYLVFYNKQIGKADLTDFSLFRRGSGHELNERYHESGDIWLNIFTPQQ